MTFNYYLNKKKSLKEYPIFLYLREKGKTITINTSQSVELSKWDDQKQRVKRHHNNCISINAFLDHFERLAKEIVNELKIAQPEVNMKQIKVSIKNKLEFGGEFDLNEVFSKFIDIKTPNVVPATIGKYKNVMRHFINFAASTKIDLDLNSIDSQTLDGFSNYLIQNGINNNTTTTYIQVLLDFLNWALENDYTNNTKFTRYKKLVKEYEPKTIALSLEELSLLANHKFNNNRLEKVRDLFLFHIYTGQRYNEISKFKISDVKEGYWIVRQDKTFKEVQVPLITQAIEILEKYNYELPIISNVKYNKYLKEVAKEVGLNREEKIHKRFGSKVQTESKPIHELITTHTARRTFISISSYMNVDERVTKSITGHKNNKMMDLYFKPNKEQNRNVFENAFKFNN